MGLLDKLCERMGCPYLSDLRRAVGTRSFRKCIETIAPGAYSVDEWNEAVQYLTGRRAANFTDAGQAQRCLVEIAPDTPCR